MKIKMIFLMCAIALTSCTENQRVRNFGGSSTIDLPAGEKLITATWKRSELWYTTRPMRPGEFPERIKFTEKSSIGLLEGTYYFQEHFPDTTKVETHLEFVK